MYVRGEYYCFTSNVIDIMFILLIINVCIKYTYIYRYEEIFS